MEGVGCPYCSGHKVLKGFNDINTTKQIIYDFLYNKEDGYKYSKNSTHRLHLKCPRCNFEFYRKITNIKEVLKCPNCQTNTFSFSENVIFNILTQFNIFFDHELSFEWSNNKRYDFYIPKYDMIIEVHGGQHYNNSFQKLCGRTINEEIINDKTKERLAKENGIKLYIQLDCRKSEISWIKKSVNNSELYKIINLNEINWDTCLEFANKNLVYDICKLWDNTISTTEFSKINKIDRSTVMKYLKIGENYGWCFLDRNIQKSIQYKKLSSHLGKGVRVVVEDKEYIFKSLAEMEEKSEEIFNKKIYKSSISRICRGLQPQIDGIFMMYL